MKHASPSATQPLQARVRRLGFNPEYLTAAEQEELIGIEGILSSSPASSELPEAAAATPLRPS